MRNRENPREISDGEKIRESVTTKNNPFKPSDPILLSPPQLPLYIPYLSNPFL